MRRAVPAAETLAGSLRDAAQPRLVLLTGGRGSSKTRWCGELAQAARDAGLSLAGVISPPVYAAGKIAIDLLAVATGERRRLAERPPPGEPGTAGLGWRFDLAALAWGNAILDNTSACDLLLIDELGPLEFRGEGGLLAGFAAIEARRYRLAVAVVRPELLDTARARWPWFSLIYDKDIS